MEERTPSEESVGQASVTQAGSPSAASDLSQIKGNVRPEAPTVPVAKESTERPPFVGPGPFAREDEQFFFGRDLEARELRALIIVNRAVLMYAQSGAGKTSLLNAGLIPLLEKEGFESYAPARISGLLPTGISPKQVTNRFAFNVLCKWSGDKVEPDLVRKSLAEFLEERKQVLSEKEDTFRLRVLIFDQFEELFYLYPEALGQRQEFISQVSTALDQDRLLRCLFVIREDYLAHFDRYAPFLPDGLRARYRLEPLRRQAAIDAIRGPLTGKRLEVLPGAAEALVERLLMIKQADESGETIEVPGEFVEPVQLQVVCQDMYSRLREKDEKVVTQDDIKGLDVNNALIRFYEASVTKAAAKAKISEEELRNWIAKHLITELGTRGMVAKAPAPKLTRGIPGEALKELEDLHLLRSELRAGAWWCELTHDRLIEPIQECKRRFDTIKRFDDAIQRNPQDKWVYLDKAEFLGKLGEYEEALKVFGGALAVDPGSAEVYLMRGRFQSDHGHFKEAIADFEKAIELDPKHQMAHECIVKELRTLHRDLEALAAVDYAMSINGESVWAYDERGFINLGLKNYTQALEDFKRRIELGPKDDYAHTTIVIELRDRDLNDEALAVLDMMLHANPENIWAYNQRGDIYLKSKKYSQAVNDFKKTIELDPEDTYAHENLVRQLEVLGLVQETLAILGEWLRVDPENVWAHTARGNNLRKAGQYDEALIAIEQAIQIDPDYIYAYNIRALVYLGKKDYEHAIFDLKMCTEAEPNEPLYPRNLGELYAAQKRYEEAESWYRKALEVDASYAAAYNDLGLLFQDLKRYEEAESAFQQAMQADASEPLYPRNLGNLYAAQRRYEEAEGWYRKALEVDASYAVAYNDLGLLFRDLKRYEEAESAFQEAMQANASEPLYPRNLGNLYAAQKRYKEAEGWYRKALEVDASYAAAYNDLGLLFQDLKRYEEAESAFQQAIQANASSPLYPRNLGNLYAAQRRYKEAEGWYRKALEVDASYAAAYNDLGLLFQNLKRYEEAESAFQQAMQADASEPLYPRNLGNLYAAQRRYEEAEVSLRKSVALGPNDAVNLNSLAWLLYEQRRQLDEAEQLARRATAIERDANYLHTLASIVVRRGNWENACGPFRDWLSLSDREFIDVWREDVINLLKECLLLIGPVRLGEIMANEALGDHWQPWVDAIKKLAGSDKPLSEAARRLYTELCPEAGRVGS